MSAWEHLIASLPPFAAAEPRARGSASVEMLNRERDAGWEAIGMGELDDGTVAVLLERRR